MFENRWLRFVLLTVLLATLGAATVPLVAKPAASPDQVRLVFFLRHAEQDRESGRDPGLNAEGHARAQELAALLETAGVTHLFASQFRRTRETLVPLSASTGLQVVEKNAMKAELQVRALRKLPPGSLAVVTGHSNTVPGMIQELGGKIYGLDERGWLDEGQYDRLFMLVLPPTDGPPLRTVELRYGKSL